jgi:DNA mismatch repair protein MutS2
MDAAEPQVKDGGTIEIISARNPLLLLGKKRAVPNSVSLSGKSRCMIVTGPNAGGKTVLIKTIGLLTLMTMAGLSIPAAPDTRIRIFPNIFIAMGDMQSVEQDLSTFSADILTMKNFYQEADNNTLILLDEVITGTDPKEGTALGQAYLKALMDRGATVFVTTHFDEIKYLPFEDDRFTVASMGFSEKDLTPTFQLTMGVPGRSMGIEIAKKIGFPGPIIEDARRYLGTKEENIDALIKELTELRDREAEMVEKLSRERSRLKELMQKGKQERTRLKEMEKEVMNEARSKAVRTVRDAEEEVEKVMEELRREKKVEVVRKAKDVISRIKKEAGQVEHPEEVRKIISKTRPVGRAGDLTPGQRVFVVSLGRDGHVESAKEGKEKVTLSLGTVKSSVSIMDIRIYGPEETKDKRGARTMITPGKEGETPFVRRDDNTIDVRGLDQEEAIKEVDLFLDRAAIADIPSIIIIHGHGTGTLKKAIRGYLRRSFYVDDFSPAPKEQGGDGATTVKLR